MSMLPGIGKIKNQLAERNLDDSVIKRQMAIIDSMTPAERKHPDILKASRKKRIAAGSGTRVEEVNRLLKMHRTMADVMKAMGGGKARGPMAGLAQMMGFGGGMPSPDELAKLAEKMPGGLPGAPGLPPNMPGLPPAMPSGLPGLGKFPGLGAGKLPTPGGLPPNFPGLGKKK
jgi:signal recognition particle subunit SRP54